MAAAVAIVACALVMGKAFGGGEVSSCFLRGGVASGVTGCDEGTGYSTWVLSPATKTWTGHSGINCYPGGHGASWGTGDLATGKSYTLAGCKVACSARTKCNAITVESEPEDPPYLPSLVQRFRPPQQTPAQARRAPSSKRRPKQTLRVHGRGWRATWAAAPCGST